jgi:hypothetical protein
MEPWNAGICARIVFVDERDLVAFPALHTGISADEKALVGHGRPTTQCSRKAEHFFPAIPMGLCLPTTGLPRGQEGDLVRCRRSA